MSSRIGGRRPMRGLRRKTEEVRSVRDSVSLEPTNSLLNCLKVPAAAYNWMFRDRKFNEENESATSVC